MSILTVDRGLPHQTVSFPVCGAVDGSEGFGCTAFELGEKGLVSLGQRGDPLLSLEAQGGHHFWEVQCNFRYHLDQGSLSILRWTSSTIGFSRFIMIYIYIHICL